MTLHEEMRMISSHIRAEFYDFHSKVYKKMSSQRSTYRAHRRGVFTRSYHGVRWSQSEWNCAEMSELQGFPVLRRVMYRNMANMYRNMYRNMFRYIYPNMYRNMYRNMYGQNVPKHGPNVPKQNLHFIFRANLTPLGPNLTSQWLTLRSWEEPETLDNSWGLHSDVFAEVNPPIFHHFWENCELVLNTPKLTMHTH